MVQKLSGDTCTSFVKLQATSLKYIFVSVLNCSGELSFCFSLCTPPVLCLFSFVSIFWFSVHFVSVWFPLHLINLGSSGRPHVHSHKSGSCARQFSKTSLCWNGAPDLSNPRQRDLCTRCLKAQSALRKGKDYETGKVTGINGRVLV